MSITWQLLPADPTRARELAHALGLHPLTAQLLINRGAATPAAARRFLQPSLDSLDDPAGLPDMEAAVLRFRRAIVRREPILIFGDSDVDGLTASVILYEALRDLGAVVHARQSNRITDGYGLPRAAVQQLCRSGTKLVVLVDCGTNQAQDIRLLASHGIDTVVIDHHVPLGDWAAPHALVNPHRTSGAGREFCSAGLAFKVVQALLGRDGMERLAECLDLAALGTLADCSPLLGDNRVIVTEGLSRLLHSHRPGLRRLCASTRVTRPDAEQVLRRLTPRLNAGGRLGDAAATWKLLLTDGDGEMEALLSETETAHATTKRLYRQMIAEADSQVSRQHFKDQLVMVVSRQGWHQGLMGPLASQLAQRYGRPAIALAMTERHGTGSARSVPLFNLLDVLRDCEELLVRFGGHAQACGLTIDRQHMEPFRALVNERARQRLGREGFSRTRTADVELSLAQVAPAWVGDLGRFAPFGIGNPKPAAVIRRVTIAVRSPRTAMLTDGATQVAARGAFDGVAAGECYDVLACPTVVDGQLELTVSGVKDGSAPAERVRISDTPYRRGSA